MAVKFSTVAIALHSEGEGADGSRLSAAMLILRGFGRPLTCSCHASRSVRMLASGMGRLLRTKTSDSDVMGPMPTWARLTFRARGRSEWTIKLSRPSASGRWSVGGPALVLRVVGSVYRSPPLVVGRFGSP